MLKPDAVKENEFDYIKKSENMLVAGRFLKSTQNGGIRIWATSSVLYDIQGNVIGAIESFRDVTGFVEV